ncbi:MAG: hypothetical protein M1140_13340 [Chloroflexi bacterium]|nr:hypothetical protein [Chloroflexota bacterium]
MPKMVKAQSYPRIEDESDAFDGFLDEPKLQPHTYKIPESILQNIILNAIISANLKSSRAILNISDNTAEEKLNAIYLKEGKALFQYFVRYCGDPASTAHACLGRHYSTVAHEQFRNRTLQKERMNSGWRYQYIAKNCAIASKRFTSVSDVGAAEADFNATIRLLDGTNPELSIYVSIKNRSNTLGGQDWPKAIRALEDVAKNDKNRTGPYICVFGITMESGLRLIRSEQKTGRPYSVNTEVWQSDFFWPFFTNYSYPAMIRIVLDTLIAFQQPDETDTDIPTGLIDSFGNMCRMYGLLVLLCHRLD